MPLDTNVALNIQPPPAPDLFKPFLTMAALKNSQLQGQNLQSEMADREEQRKQRALQNEKAVKLAKLYQDAAMSGEDQDSPGFIKKIYEVDPAFGEAHEQHRSLLKTQEATRKNLESEANSRETPAERVKLAEIKANEPPPAEKEYQAWRAANQLPDGAFARQKYQLQKTKLSPGEIIPGEPGQPPLASAPEKPPTDDFQAVYLPAYLRAHNVTAQTPQAQRDQIQLQAVQDYKKSAQDPAMQQILRENASNARLDRSYAASNTELENKRKPIDAESANIAQAKSLLAQNDPGANSFVAPAIIKAVVGGAGSGVRITTPEINAVNNGRGKILNFESWLSSWSLDPSKYQALLPEQKVWLNGVLNKLDEKVQAKQAVLSDAAKKIRMAPDVDSHRKALNDLEDNLAGIDRGAPAVGTVQGGYVFMGGDPANKASWKKQ